MGRHPRTERRAPPLRLRASRRRQSPCRARREARSYRRSCHRRSYCRDSVELANRPQSGVRRRTPHRRRVRVGGRMTASGRWHSSANTRARRLHRPSRGSSQRNFDRADSPTAGSSLRLRHRARRPRLRQTCRRPRNGDRDTTRSLRVACLKSADTESTSGKCWGWYASRTKKFVSRTTGAPVSAPLRCNA